MGLLTVMQSAVDSAIAGGSTPGLRSVLETALEDLEISRENGTSACH
jgi:hypothetical protein